ncbi:MAG: hypothetical protein R3Y59_03170 [bacterium]
MNSRTPLERFLKTVITAKTNSAGTYTSNKFDDSNNTLDLMLTSIKVWEGDVIDCIEFVYDNKSYAKGKSPYFHGGLYGVMREFKIMPGDFLRRIDFKVGKYPFSMDVNQRNVDMIVQIKFTTRDGNESRWYGNCCGKGSRMVVSDYTIDVGPENVIFALYGATQKANMALHNYVQALGTYYLTYISALEIVELKNNCK